MPYSNEIIEIKKSEKETKAFKLFTRLAKKIMYLEYGKWTLTPDPIDPLRKVVLSKDIGLVTLHLSLYMCQFQHRGVWYEDRYDYRPKLAITGLLQKSKHDDNLIYTDVKLGPRSAQKILDYVNMKIVPMFYESVANEVKVQETRLAGDAELNNNVAKVPGLKISEVQCWDNTAVGELEGCPFKLRPSRNTVYVQSAELTYEQLAEMAQRMGWGK